MRLSELENKIDAPYPSIAAAVLESIGRFASAPKGTLERLVPDKEKLLRATIAIAAASVGTVVLGSLVRGHGPWAGIDAMMKGLPWLRPRRLGGLLLWRRPSRAFEAARKGGLVAHVVLGSLALAAVQGAVGDKLTKSRVGRGALTGGTAFALDRLFMGRRFLDALDRAIGREATALTFGAIAAAYALTSGAKKAPEHDPAGGDIAAGVPAT